MRIRCGLPRETLRRYCPVSNTYWGACGSSGLSPANPPTPDHRQRERSNWDKISPLIFWHKNDVYRHCMSIYVHTLLTTICMKTDNEPWNNFMAFWNASVTVRRPMSIHSQAHTHIYRKQILIKRFTLWQSQTWINYFCCTEFQFCYESNLSFIKNPKWANTQQIYTAKTNWANSRSL